jgi:hypothetical protein
MKPGDEIQIIYKRNKTMTIEVVQAKLVDSDWDWIYLDNGKRYNKSKIQNLRNITKENKKFTGEGDLGDDEEE